MHNTNLLDLVDTRGAAKIVGLKPGTLVNMRIHGGSPPYRKHGRRVYYLVSDLIAWSNQHVRLSTSQTANVAH